MFASFHDVDTPTMVNFKLPKGGGRSGVGTDKHHWSICPAACPQNQELFVSSFGNEVFILYLKKKKKKNSWFIYLAVLSLSFGTQDHF